MARIVQTIAAPGVDTGGGLSSAQVLALIQANTGYEYVKTVTLNTTEVTSVDITGLDATIYSGFKIVSSRLGYGGSTSQSTWTFQVITGTSTVDSSNTYEYQGIKFTSATGLTGSGQTGWSTTWGWGGPPSVADFTMDYIISPGASYDANMRLHMGDSKTGGYWPSSGIMCGLHSTISAVPTGIRITCSQNLRAINDYAYITVLGLRIKS